MITDTAVEPIYERYTTALRMVSGNGDWIDDGAARLSLWLALTELAGTHAVEESRLQADIESLQADIESLQCATEAEVRALRKTIADLELTCLTSPSPSTPTTAETGSFAPDAFATSSASAISLPHPAGRSSTNETGPAPIASIASSTTPSAAPSAALPAMPPATAKRYRMSTEEMKAKVLEYIRRNTIDGVAPTAQGVGKHTDVPMGALCKRLGCKYADLVAEAGSKMQRGDHSKGAAMNSNASFRTP